jgi:hypothetical protein
MSAATIASSRGPATGMNSGIRSIGDAIQTIANPSQSLALRGTLGSRNRPRKSTSRLGISLASSRACDRRPRAISTMTRDRPDGDRNANPDQKTAHGALRLLPIAKTPSRSARDAFGTSRRPCLTQQRGRSR